MRGELTRGNINESRTEFQHYFEKAAIGLGASSPDKKFIEVNNRFCQMVGYSREELIGMSWLTISHGEDFDKNIEFFQQAVDCKIDRYELTKRFIRKDGSVLYVLLSTVCERKEDGTIDHFITSYQDITVQEKAEEALKESEERFRSLFENSPMGIYRTTPDGQILMANAALVRMLGYKSFKDLRQRDLNHDGSCYPRSKFQQMIESKGEIKGLESAWNRKDGSIIYIRESATMVRDKDGKPLYYEGIIEDISDRKIAEGALRESEEKYRSLFENMIEGFAYCKMIYENEQPVDFVYLGINSSFETLTGLKQVVGKRVSEVIPGIQRSDSELLKIYGRVASTGNPERIETYLKALKMWFSISVYSPSKGYFVAVFDVINERKRVEQELIKAKEKAEESEKLKSAFLANMSHEIRTPMNGIMGFAELLREPRLTGEEQQEYIEIIQKSGERMLTIINDIISISKVEAGQMKVLLSETHLNDLSEYIFKFFNHEAEQRGLTFSCSTQFPGNEAIIHTDKEKISAVLINLIKNALKFTPKGNSVKFGYEIKGSVCTFFVKDTGIGIPPEQKDIIFERFRQVNDSFNRKFEGAGLGLSISKAYVEMLGGKIWVESQYKAGSTFYFTIPDCGVEKQINE